MKVFTSVNDPEIVRILTSGGIGVIRTDTLYGLVGQALDETAIQRIYDLKDRDAAKSPIVLIASTDQLFDEPSEEIQEYTKSAWPGAVSIIIPSTESPVWIRRDNGSVAYRVPDDSELLSLLSQTGALVAPSANPEGQTPAMNLDEAVSYFGDNVDFYADSGQVDSAEPSKLVTFDDSGNVVRLR